MKNKPPKQAELPFKPTEFQLDLLVGKSAVSEEKLQFFASKKCQVKSKQASAELAEKTKTSINKR